MKTIRKTTETDYIIYTDNNINEVEEFLKGRVSFGISKDDVFETIEEAEQMFKDMLRDDNVHGESYFERLDPDGEWFYTKEGKVLLSADVEWNRYDKQYYFIERIKIKVEEQLPFEEPEMVLYINDKLVNKNTHIVYDEIFGVGVLTKSNFKTHYSNKK